MNHLDTGGQCPLGDESIASAVRARHDEQPDAEIPSEQRRSVVPSLDDFERTARNPRATMARAYLSGPATS